MPTRPPSRTFNTKIRNRFGITYPLRRGQEGYFESSYSVMEQVKSNLKNLLLTRIGERLHQPTFGCDLHKIIFEPNDDGIKQKATDYIEAAVSIWMPYIIIEDLEYTADKDQYKFFIKLIFSLNDTTDTINLSVTL